MFVLAIPDAGVSAKELMGVYEYFRSLNYTHKLFSRKYNVQ